MQNVPRGPMLSRAAFSRIVVAEAINHDIPEWAIPRDQHPFRHPNPHIVEDEVAATEVAHVEVFGLCHRGRVFSQPVRERGASGCVPITAAPTALGIGLADVYRCFHPLAIDFRKRSVCVKVAEIIYGVNARALERLRRKRLRFLPQQRACRAFG